MASKKADPGSETNMGVDYIIKYRFSHQDKEKAVSGLQTVLEALYSVGFEAEVRNGDKETVLIFVKMDSEEHLYGEIYRSRVKDWLHGVRTAAPDKDLDDDALSHAERLRVVYQLITNPKRQGGAGILPGRGKWENVEDIFALHDHQYNKQWLKKWASTSMLKVQDLDEIRDQFGEKVAFYFAFTQQYFTALMSNAALGIASWVLLGGFSPVYAVVNTLLCVAFIEYWKYQEENLAIRWGVKGVSTIEAKRHTFKPEQQINDPVTGEPVQFFPTRKRLKRQLLQVPFALGAAFILGTLIATCFAIEIFVSEIYKGPMQGVVVFLPTVILSTFQPLVLGALTDLAEKLTLYENYETHGAYETAMTQKIFVLNFITSYMGIFLTAFVYVPFATVIVPYLDVFQLRSKNIKTRQLHNFNINPDRLKKQVIYFTVTAQIVNQVLEVVVPYLKRRGITKVKTLQTQRAMKRASADEKSTIDPSADDPADEKAFLARVRKEASLPAYDVTTDFREMVVQYGYLALFSVVWPLTSVSFLANNWIELRTDAVKICHESQRPTPWRAEGIGPWLDSLGFLTWLGSITTAAIVYMFRTSTDDGVDGPAGAPDDLRAWALLLTIFFSEHTYLLIRWGARHFVSRLDSPGRQKERRERFRVRRKYLDETSVGDQAARVRRTTSTSQSQSQKSPLSEVNRQSLEEEARDASITAAKPEDRFWMRQRGMEESLTVGSRLIERGLAAEEKKTR